MTTPRAIQADVTWLEIDVIVGPDKIGEKPWHRISVAWNSVKSTL